MSYLVRSHQGQGWGQGQGQGQGHTSGKAGVVPEDGGGASLPGVSYFGFAVPGGPGPGSSGGTQHALAMATSPATSPATSMWRDGASAGVANNIGGTSPVVSALAAAMAASGRGMQQQQHPSPPGSPALWVGDAGGAAEAGSSLTGAGCVLCLVVVMGGGRGGVIACVHVLVR